LEQGVEENLWTKVEGSNRRLSSYMICTPGQILLGQSRSLRWTWNVARMGEKTDSCIVLVGKPEGKIPLGRRRRRLSDNIKMNLKEIG
jgi:hypothetical protein